MDAKPMTPAEIAARLRAVTEEDAYAQPWTFGQHCIAGADCIDAQAAEIAVYKSEQEELFASMESVRAANKSLAAEITALRAERDALAARLAVPDDDKLKDLLSILSAFGAVGTHSLLFRRAHHALTALRARVAGLEGALTTLLAGDCPRPLGMRWRADGKPSSYDRCTHGAMMNETCKTCADAFIRAALSPSAQEACDNG